MCWTKARAVRDVVRRGGCIRRHLTWNHIWNIGPGRPIWEIWQLLTPSEGIMIADLLVQCYCLLQIYFDHKYEIIIDLNESTSCNTDCSLPSVAPPCAFQDCFDRPFWSYIWCSWTLSSCARWYCAAQELLSPRTGFHKIHKWTRREGDSSSWTPLWGD